MNKELKIGLLAIVAIIILVFGINYLKGISFLNSSRVFYAVYENIGGLKVGDPVMVNGYKVGMVSDLALLIEKNQNLLVTINIEKEFEMSSNTVCKIVNQDLLGTKGISLILGDASDLLELGDTLISDIEGTLQSEVNAQILPLKNKAEELISSIDSVVTVITAVLSKDARESLTKSLESLDHTFSTMSKTMTKVNKIVDQNDDRISSIVKNLEENNDEITNILRNFSDISDDIAKSNIKNLLASLGEVSKKISDSEGSLGMFINDKDLYLNLKKSSKELETLIKDIKLHPKRYVGFSILGGGNSYVEPKSK